MDISNKDFVNSFLKAARERKLSVTVFYGEMVGTRAVMRLVSNVGEKGTKEALAWLRAQPVEATPAELADPTPPSEVS